MTTFNNLYSVISIKNILIFLKLSMICTREVSSSKLLGFTYRQWIQFGLKYWVLNILQMPMYVFYWLQCLILANLTHVKMEEHVVRKMVHHVQKLSVLAHHVILESSVKYVSCFVWDYLSCNDRGIIAVVCPCYIFQCVL